MAKLSKMEISAIANKIVDDITTANQKYNDELKEKEFKVWIVKYQKTKDYKVLKQYFDLQEDLYRITKNLSYSYSLNKISKLDKLLNEIFVKDNKLQLKYVMTSKENIERDIIIAQARNVDIDALITELTEKYSK